MKEYDEELDVYYLPIVNRLRGIFPSESEQNLKLEDFFSWNFAGSYVNVSWDSDERKTILSGAVSSEHEDLENQINALIEEYDSSKEVDEEVTSYSCLDDFAN